MNSSNSNALDQNDTMQNTATKSEENVCCGIYGLRNKINGKWYIGQSTNIKGRWNKYKRMACNSQEKLFRALSKYGYDAFEKIILEECGPDRQELNDRESFWIEKYNSIKNGYNIRCGGSSGKYSFSLESIDKMSKSHIGKKLSLETRKKMSDSQKRVIRDLSICSELGKLRRGVKASIETRKKMSQSRLGVKRGPMSEEHKSKIRESCIKTKSQKRLTSS